MARRPPWDSRVTYASAGNDRRYPSYRVYFVNEGPLTSAYEYKDVAKKRQRLLMDKLAAHRDPMFRSPKLEGGWDNRAAISVSLHNHELHNAQREFFDAPRRMYSDGSHEPRFVVDEFGQRHYTLNYGQTAQKGMNATRVHSPGKAKSQTQPPSARRLPPLGALTMLQGAAYPNEALSERNGSGAGAGAAGHPVLSPLPARAPASAAAPLQPVPPAKPKPVVEPIRQIKAKPAASEEVKQLDPAPEPAPVAAPKAASSPKAKPASPKAAPPKAAPKPPSPKAAPKPSSPKAAAVAVVPASPKAASPKVAKVVSPKAESAPKAAPIPVAATPAASSAVDSCGSASVQSGWKACSRCSALYMAASPLRCLSDEHDDTGSAAFAVSTVEHKQCNTQAGWRRCGSCGVLANGTGSCSAADGNPHRLSGDELHVCQAKAHGREGWSACTACAALVSRDGGACPRSATGHVLGAAQYQVGLAMSAVA